MKHFVPIACALVASFTLGVAGFATFGQSTPKATPPTSPAPSSRPASEPVRMPVRPASTEPKRPRKMETARPLDKPTIHAERPAIYRPAIYRPAKDKSKIVPALRAQLQKAQAKNARLMEKLAMRKGPAMRKQPMRKRPMRRTTSEEPGGPNVGEFLPITSGWRLVESTGQGPAPKVHVRPAVALTGRALELRSGGVASR